jgi:hypothetical protein
MRLACAGKLLCGNRHISVYKRDFSVVGLYHIVL